MDTDIEVVKPLDELLDTGGIYGFEIETKIYWSLSGAASSPLWKNGTTITMTENLSGRKRKMSSPMWSGVTELLQNHGLELNNHLTNRYGVEIFP